jgi:hypothetical protein
MRFSSHPPCLDHSNYIWRSVQVTKLLAMQFCHQAIRTFVLYYLDLLFYCALCLHNQMNIFNSENNLLKAIYKLSITSKHFYNNIRRWNENVMLRSDRLYSLVIRVLGYRSGGPGSIPGTTRFSDEKRKKKENSSGSGTGSTQPREYNWGATW